ncbi:hypothetical protein [Arthrobacter ginkgonis]|uniref:hypothetical protein n=1 Tax=Arthrobacter ginkgonis TaxID=1630594 RepID=UPI0031EFF62B
MSESAEVHDYLVALARNVEGITSKLPATVHATVGIRHGAVYTEVRGPRWGTFTLVQGSEAPETVYDGQYIHHHLIGEGMEDQLEHTQDTLDEIVDFLLSDRILTEGTSRILRRRYLSMPLADGDEWRFRWFNPR